MVENEYLLGKQYHLKRLVEAVKLLLKYKVLTNTQIAQPSQVDAGEVGVAFVKSQS